MKPSHASIDTTGCVKPQCRDTPSRFTKNKKGKHVTKQNQNNMNHDNSVVAHLNGLSRSPQNYSVEIRDCSMKNTKYDLSFLLPRSPINAGRRAE